MLKMPSDIHVVILPVPPNFEKVLGYWANRKWVAFYWTPYGDELEFYDGYNGGTIDWQGWIAFTRHKLVVPIIQSYDFGSSESAAKHWLLLDRQERQFYVGEESVVSGFLESFSKQFISDPIEVSSEQLMQLAMEWSTHSKKSCANDSNKFMDEVRSKIDDMVKWLDDIYDIVMKETDGKQPE